MATYEQSAASTEYVRVAVSAREGATVVNPTADVVKMAFVPYGTTPDDLDFVSATWETDSATTPPTYYARCLVGPSGVIELDSDIYSYAVWVDVTDNPETPRRLAGLIKITP